MHPTARLLLLLPAACLPTVHGAHYQAAGAGAPVKEHRRLAGGIGAFNR